MWLPGAEHPEGDDPGRALGACGLGDDFSLQDGLSCVTTRSVSTTHLAPADTSDFPPQPFHGLLLSLLFAALE